MKKTFDTAELTDFVQNDIDGRFWLEDTIKDIISGKILLPSTFPTFLTEEDEESIRDEGYEAGYEYGNESGFESGYDSGFEAGREEGYDEGYEEGKADAESKAQSGL